MECTTKQTSMDTIHRLIHDAAHSLTEGNIDEVKRIHREIDVMTHDAIDQQS